MHDDPNSHKYASADKPINRRTVKPATTGLDHDVNPVVLARMKAADARQRLGPRLATHLELGQKTKSDAAVNHTALVLPAVAATVSLVGVMLGAINGEKLLAALAGMGFLAAFAWGYASNRRQKARYTESAVTQIELVSKEELNALDSLLEQLSTSSDETLLERAMLLKDTIARSLNTINKNAQSVVAPDDQLFLREAIRRYIPDSVNGWLKVNNSDRNTLRLENGATANEALAGQLKTLDDALRTREQRMAQALSETLLQQQRFLDAKTGKSR